MAAKANYLQNENDILFEIGIFNHGNETKNEFVMRKYHWKMIKSEESGKKITTVASLEDGKLVTKINGILNPNISILVENPTNLSENLTVPVKLKIDYDTMLLTLQENTTKDALFYKIERKKTIQLSSNSWRQKEYLPICGYVYNQKGNVLS